MKLCWDNIEGFHLTKLGNLINLKTKKYLYIKICAYCKEEFLAHKKGGVFCSNKCSSIGDNNSMFGKGYIISGKNHPNYGKKLPKETKERMSNAQMGNKNHFYGKRHSDATKMKISLNSGSKRNEIKEKISKALKGKMKGKNNPFYGKRHTEETRKKMSINHMDTFGPDNPNWKGGISCEPYCFEWSSKEFKDLIKERDNYVCQNPDCRNNSKRLCVHHIDYNKKNCTTNNLITLCTSCNTRANYDREWYIGYYKILMRKKYGYKY